MSQLRQIQILAIILLLVAGYLWSNRWSDQIVANNIAALHSPSTEQENQVKDRTEAQDDPYELVNFGRKLLTAGNPAFAIIPLEKAVKLDEKYRDGWYLLGYSYIQIANELPANRPAGQRQDYHEKAINALQKAKGLDPTHEPTLQLLKQLGVNN